MSKNALAHPGADDKHANGEKVPGAQTIMRLYEPIEFTMISNAGARDRRLSAEARGVLWTIMTLPLDWCFNVSWAMREFDMGRARVYRIINELKDAGYMRHMRARDSRGRMLEARYYIAADPRSFELNQAISPPHTETPEVDDSPRVENQHVDETPRVDYPRVENPRLDNRHAYKGQTSTKDGVVENGAQAREGDKPAFEGEGRWWSRLHFYRQRANWPNTWGPFMHKPGCQAPARLVKLWDDTAGEAFKHAEEPKPGGKKHRAKGANGFAKSGTLNLPGTSHD
jgi:hypothetical protein